MKLDNIISVSGLPGLYKLVTTRPSGLMIESYGDNKRQFVSARKHQFTPLASIGIYTYTDVVAIEDVFKKIKSTENEHPVPEHQEGGDTLRSWFKIIISDHDEDRVHLNDIRKVIKWYNFLKQHGELEDIQEENESEG